MEPLSLFDQLYIRFFYMLRAWNCDLPENKVGWRSRKNQELRFQSLMRIGDLQDKSILDLGCGLGCLYGYLKGIGWRGQYTGVDILDFMVKAAKARYPDARFEKRDVLKDPPDGKWDYVIINGVFNHKVRDNWAWIERMVKWGLESSRAGMGFTMLNRKIGWLDKDLFYARPEELEEKVKLWSGGNYKIMMDYLSEDMTAYLYH